MDGDVELARVLMSSLLAALRRRTADSHERLHKHPVLSELTSPHLTLDYYGFSLARFYGFYLNYERLYQASGHDLLAHFPAGGNLSWLAHDLARLDIDIKALPVLQTQETRLEPAQVLAYLYLREGSNLGGKVISRHLENSLGLRAGIDNRFFWGNGEFAGDAWRNLKAWLEHYGQSIDIDEAGQYAGILFERLEAWLSLHEESTCTKSPG